MNKLKGAWELYLQNSNEESFSGYREVFNSIAKRI
jgi:hypothetical protein